MRYGEGDHGEKQTCLPCVISWGWLVTFNWPRLRSIMLTSLWIRQVNDAFSFVSYFHLRLNYHWQKFCTYLLKFHKNIFFTSFTYFLISPVSGTIIYEGIMWMSISAYFLWLTMCMTPAEVCALISSYLDMAALDSLKIKSYVHYQTWDN